MRKITQQGAQIQMFHLKETGESLSLFIFASGFLFALLSAHHFLFPPCTMTQAIESDDRQYN